MNLNNKTRLILLNDGPVPNSNSEINLLAPLLEKFEVDILAWSGPSSLEGKESAPFSYENCIDVLDKFLEKNISGNTFVVAHSFALQYLVPLLPQYQNKIAGLILLNPTFDIAAFEENILKTAIEDFKKHSDKNPGQFFKERTQIEAYLANSLTKSLDQTKLDALLIAQKDTDLFKHFFYKAENYLKYFSYLKHQDFFHAEEYYKLRTSMPQNLTKQTFILPTLVIFGDKNPIVRAEDQLAGALDFFPNAKFDSYNESSHFPHLEEMELFVSELLSFVNENGPKFTTPVNFEENEYSRFDF